MYVRGVCVCKVCVYVRGVCEGVQGVWGVRGYV